MGPILLATDGSASADAATDEAIDLAKRHHTPLLVACVAREVTSPAAVLGYGIAAAELQRAEREHVEDVIAEVARRARLSGVEPSPLSLGGSPGAAICAAAANEHASLVVCGSHGWSRLAQAVRGSVSHYVLQHAAQPVLVVHQAS